MGNNEQAVLDLTALRRAAAALIACYDTHLDCESVDIGKLERARADVERHLPLPGRLGRDLNIVLGNYPRLSATEVAAAVERVRSLAPAPAPPSAFVTARASRTRRRSPIGTQPALPGLDVGDQT